MPTLEQLREDVRVLLDDPAGAKPYWTDAELNSYLNEAYNIFCRSTKIIIDSLTAAVCTLTVAEAAQHAALSPLILKIDNAKGSWGAKPLERIMLSELNEHDPLWVGTAGIPTKYTREYSAGYLSLNRAATTAGTITLTVRRMPLVDLTADADLPEFDAKYHWMLKDYALHKAFSKQDAELYNPEKGVYHKTLFMGTDEVNPGGHILRVMTELDPLPQKRKTQFF